jgi:hypothetical protein
MPRLLRDEHIYQNILLRHYASNNNTHVLEILVHPKHCSSKASECWCLLSSADLGRTQELLPPFLNEDFSTSLSLRIFLSRLQPRQPLLIAGSKRPPVQRLIDPLDILVNSALGRALFGSCVLFPPSVVFSRSRSVMP